MAEGGISHAALDMGHDRERRVHQHHCRDQAGIEMIVDLGGVEAGDGQGRKEGGKQAGADLGQFVDEQRTAGDLGQDGEEPGAGRGLQHAVGVRDRRRRHRSEAERDRGGELLEGLRFLGTPGVGRQEPGNFRKLRQDCRRRPGFAEKCIAVFAQEEDGRRLAGIIGGLPVPSAGGIGRAEGGLHGAAQRGGVDTLTAFQMRQQQTGSGENAGRGLSVMVERKRRGGGCRRGCGNHVHRGFLGRASQDQAGQRSLSTAPAQTPSGPSLALKPWRKQA